MPTLPSALALTTIADGSFMIASDERNNFTAIQTAVNALITALSGGSAGSLLQALSSTSVGYAKVVTGRVSSAGAVVSGSGFSSVKNSTGNYTITYTVAFAAAPVVLITPEASTGIAGAMVATPVAGSFNAIFYVTNTVAANDAAFSFVAFTMT